jgi:allantoicase
MTDVIAPVPSAAELPGWARGTVNLASPRFGTAAVRCSDDSFAPAARMLADGPAVFRPGVYDDFGKWMDGWESKRRRDGGHDWCVVRLGVKGLIAGFDLDTSFFTGNFPPAAQVLAAATEHEPGPGDWTAVTPVAPLGPSAHHFVAATAPGPWRWLRLEIHPDGGVARLRVHGRPVPDWTPAADGLVELSALRNGGRAVAWNDAHYGEVEVVLSEGRGRDMGDGWETRRRREPGHDWLIVALGAAGTVERLEIDTAHYKGNFPDRASVAAARVDAGDDRGIVTRAMFWPLLLPERKLSADAIHVFGAGDLAALGPVTHLRLDIHPDGGVSRFRAFGRLA